MIKNIEKKRLLEQKVIGQMVKIYCKKKHKMKKGILCADCKEALEYAIVRIERCPHMVTKTFCSICKTPCYKPEMRLKIKDIMRFSGPRMIIYHPIIAIKHLIQTKKVKSNGQRKIEKQ